MVIGANGQIGENVLRPVEMARRQEPESATAQRRQMVGWIVEPNLRRQTLNSVTPTLVQVGSEHLYI